MKGNELLTKMLIFEETKQKTKTKTKTKQQQKTLFGPQNVQHFYEGSKTEFRTKFVIFTSNSLYILDFVNQKF